MKITFLLKIIALVLAIFYGLMLLLWFLTVGQFSLESALLAALLLAALGLIAQKEWARRLLIVGSGIGLAFSIVESLMLSQGPDLLSVFFVLVCLIVLFFYNYPALKQLYQSGFESASWDLLVIDDDKIFLKLMRSNFLRKGNLIATALTGEKGFELARKRRPDLIVLDEILPGIKGHEVCALLKEDSRTREIPIIFLTVKHSKDDIRAEFEAGAILHMTKPVDFQVLYSEIRKILGT